MSHLALTWAFKAEPDDPLAKLVLLILANRHNPQSGLFPSHRRIASDTGLSRATVIRKLARLEHLGFIRRLQPDSNSGSKRRSLTYKLAIDPGFEPVARRASGTCRTRKHSDGLPLKQSKGRTQQLPDVSLCDPNLYLETVTSESPPKAPPAPDDVPDLAALAAHLATFSPDTSTKPALCDALALAIAQLDLEFRRDVRIDDRGDGRAGVVDIVVMRAGLPWLAISVDRTQPTQKSAAKLAEFPGGLIVLRESAWSGDRFLGFPVIHFRRPDSLQRTQTGRSPFDEVARKVLGKEMP